MILFRPSKMAAKPPFMVAEDAYVKKCNITEVTPGLLSFATICV